MPAVNFRANGANKTYWGNPKTVPEGKGLIYRNVIVDGEKTKEYTDALEGILVDVALTEGEYQGKTTEKIEFHLLDPKNGHIDVYQLGRRSMLAQNFIQILYEQEKIGWVLFFPYDHDYNGKSFRFGSIRHSVDIPASGTISGKSNERFKVKMLTDRKEIEKVEMKTVELPDGSVGDFSNEKKVYAAWDAKVEAIKSKLIGAGSVSFSTVASAPLDDEEPVTEASYAGDEVPF